MSLPAPDYANGTICKVCYNAIVGNQFVEILDNRWNPMHDDDWLCRIITGPSSGMELRVWAHLLTAVSPLEALAAQA